MPPRPFWFGRRHSTDQGVSCLLLFFFPCLLSAVCGSLFEIGPRRMLSFVVFQARSVRYRHLVIVTPVLSCMLLVFSSSGYEKSPRRSRLYVVSLVSSSVSVLRCVPVVLYATGGINHLLLFTLAWLLVHSASFQPFYLLHCDAV